MSYLYNVYGHPEKGQWGFNSVAHNGEVRTAALTSDGRATLAKLDPIKLAPALQQRLRAGFQKVSQPKYLYLAEKDGGLRGEFVVQHPDLGSTLQGDLVFFIAVPQGAEMKAVAAAWRERLEEQDGNGHSRDRWLELCEHATAYVPVKTGDVHAALVAAQWAKDNNLVLVSSAGEMPQKGPAEQRHDWRCFLSTWFPQADIDRALTDLGWPLAEAINSPVEPVQTSTTPAAQEGWLALAQQASF
jgi:hypothetical protein